jgi:hypothetical protein
MITLFSHACLRYETQLLVHITKILYFFEIGRLIKDIFQYLYCFVCSVFRTIIKKKAHNIYITGFLKLYKIFLFDYDLITVSIIYRNYIYTGR